MPLVSVVIPTYNRPETLGRAVQSVLDQTLGDLEVVVVNDRGDDLYDTVPQLQDPRVRYLGHVRNSGPAAARNTALLAASGKYLAYLDDDDYFYPNHLETLVTFLESSEYRAGYVDALEVTVLRTPESYKELKRELVFSKDFNLLEMPGRNLFPNLCLVHERSCLQETGLFDESLTSHEDWDFCIRLTALHPPAHLAIVTAEYLKVLRADRVSVSSNRRDNLRTMMLIYRKYRALAVQHPAVLELQRNSMLALEQEIWGLPRERRLMTIAAFYEKHGELERALQVYSERLTHKADARALEKVKELKTRLSAGDGADGTN